jgi:hypothetical protein
MTDWSDIRYNLSMVNSSSTMDVNWGASSGTWEGANVVVYTPPSMLPPVPTDVAEDDLAWLRERVTEIEEFSRIAA